MSDIKIVHNKLLGGWYVVRGPHQTPLNGRFNSKEEAQAWLNSRAKKNPFDDFKIRGSHFFTILFHGPKNAAVSEATQRKIPFEVLESYKNPETGRFETIGKVPGNAEFALKKWEKTGEVRKVDYQKMSLNPVKKSRSKYPRYKWYVFKYKDGPAQATNLLPHESPEEFGKNNGAYAAIGPFKTSRGAYWAAKNERGLWQTVNEAERFAKLEMKKNPKSRSRYKHKRIKSARAFDARSIRTISKGGKKIRVGCPKGKYSPKKKRCNVGTRAQAILTPKKNITEYRSMLIRWFVDIKITKGKWKSLAAFDDKKDAIEYAHAYANAHNKQMRIRAGKFARK